MRIRTGGATLGPEAHGVAIVRRIEAGAPREEIAMLLRGARARARVEALPALRRAGMADLLDEVADVG